MLVLAMVVLGCETSGEEICHLLFYKGFPKLQAVLMLLVVKVNMAERREQ